MRFLEAQEDFSERGFEVLPRDIDFLRDGLKFFLWQSLVKQRSFGHKVKLTLSGTHVLLKSIIDPGTRIKAIEKQRRC